MSDVGEFFAFYDVVDPAGAFPLFGARHMMMVALMILGLSWALKWVSQLPKESSWRAVSYTHLDVYKRQPFQYRWDVPLAAL